MDEQLQRALSYLAAHQQKSGGYKSYSSAQKVPFEIVHTYQTVFVPALILAALHPYKLQPARDIKKRLADFLLTQKSRHWSFNYWYRESREAHQMPYPDDLDDTFCALSALWLYDAHLIDESALAHIVKLLIATETAPGGPYKTWLADKEAPAVWQDADLAVNANIAHFLRIALEPLPKLTALTEAAIADHGFASPYYPDEYPIIYFVSRAYRGSRQKELATYILSQTKPDGSWGSPLKTALAVSSLHQLGHSTPKTAKKYLLAQQLPDGSWPAEAFCIDPSRAGQKFYHGSATLTTALVLEALDTPTTLKRSTPKVAASQHPLLRGVERKTVAMLARLPMQDRRKTAAVLHTIAFGKNGKEIILLPEHFYNSLSQKRPLAEDVLTNLATASFCGWAAYTLYDDFIDDEGDARSLMPATILMRQSLQAFLRLVPNDAVWQRFVSQTFDTMDAANAWELAYCRCTVEGGMIVLDELPSYGRRSRLAERSWGHALVPMGILAATGISPNEPKARLLHKALHHYLIARQLNDDAHDWQDDLRAGRITYVVAELLQAHSVHAGSHQLDLVIAEMEPQFWRVTLPAICRSITYHTKKSRQLLKQSQLVVADNVITSLLDGLDDAVHTAQTHVTQAENFLQAYRQSE